MSLVGKVSAKGPSINPPSVVTEDVTTELPKSGTRSPAPLSGTKSSNSSFFIDPLEVINMGSRSHPSSSPYMEDDVSGDDSKYWFVTLLKIRQGKTR
jgi:hypothetical protein